MAVINQINLVNNVGESETYDIETKITPAVCEYIQNQNLLSDFESITLGTTSATATEMPYDGFLTVSHRPIVVGGSSSASVHINEQVFSSDYSTSQNFIITQKHTYPVKKGDLVYVTGQTSTEGIARFFKTRYYAD